MWGVNINSKWLTLDTDLAVNSDFSSNSFLWIFSAVSFHFDSQSSRALVVRSSSFTLPILDSKLHLSRENSLLIILVKHRELTLYMHIRWREKKKKKGRRNGVLETISLIQELAHWYNFFVLFFSLLTHSLSLSLSLSLFLSLTHTHTHTHTHTYTHTMSFQIFCR